MLQLVRVCPNGAEPCSIEVMAGDDGKIQVSIEQGEHTVLVDFEQWKEIRRAIERAVDFVNADTVKRIVDRAMA